MRNREERLRTDATANWIDEDDENLIHVGEWWPEDLDLRRLIADHPSNVIIMFTFRFIFRYYETFAKDYYNWTATDEQVRFFLLVTLKERHENTVKMKKCIFSLRNITKTWKSTWFFPFNNLSKTGTLFSAIYQASNGTCFRMNLSCAMLQAMASSLSTT